MKEICNAIIAGYAAGKSGLDDDMLDQIVDLGDYAEDIVAMIDRDARLSLALAQIIDARDHCAEHGTHPAGTVGPDQGFDDWAADLAQSALETT